MSKALVLVCFVVAFAAGLAVGFQSRHTARDMVQPPQPSKGSLSDELNLTPGQQEQMKKIWSGTRWRERDERRRQLGRARDEAVAALIPQEYKQRYQQIQQEYADQKEALEREMREAFHEAVEQTKGILTSEQWERYESKLKSRWRGSGGRDWDRGFRGGERRGRSQKSGRQGDDRATSAPASSQSE